MRIADVDILIITAQAEIDADHWQARWARYMATARRVDHLDPAEPSSDRSAERVAAAAARCTRPVVLVAHGLGIAAVAHAGSRLGGGAVAGAFLVGPADVDNAAGWPGGLARNGGAAALAFAPLPLARLPFPTRMIASSTDPYCTIERAQELAQAWGADVSIIANAGHIDDSSGHGPWPEGLLTFGLFLRSLDD